MLGASGWRLEVLQRRRIGWLLLVAIATGCTDAGLFDGSDRLEVVVASSSIEINGKAASPDDLVTRAQKLALRDDPQPIAISLAAGVAPERLADVTLMLDDSTPIELPMSPAAVAAGRTIGAPPAFVWVRPDSLAVAAPHDDRWASIPGMEDLLLFLVGLMAGDHLRDVVLLPAEKVSEERLATVIEVLGSAKVGSAFFWSAEGFVPIELESGE